MTQLVALHEFEGKRFNRYHELGQYALGKRLGDFAVITPQLIVSHLRVLQQPHIKELYILVPDTKRPSNNARVKSGFRRTHNTSFFLDPSRNWSRLEDIIIHLLNK